jgi:hypothetical protein
MAFGNMGYVLLHRATADMVVRLGRAPASVQLLGKIGKMSRIPGRGFDNTVGVQAVVGR